MLINFKIILNEEKIKLSILDQLMLVRISIGGVGAEEIENHN